MRWIELPVIGRFQPSEFVKIGLILFFSWYLEKYQEKINRPSSFVCGGVCRGSAVLDFGAAGSFHEHCHRRFLFSA